MKNYRDSDYAVNKYADGIVYRFSNQTLEVTLADYLRENPGKTEADFAELKALSDSMYLNDDKADYCGTWKNVPIHGLEETDACCVPSAEFGVIDMPEEIAAQELRRKLAKRAMDALTETQRRRYLLHTVNGLSTWQIAEQEGINQKSVYESIQAAEKKIKNVLTNV